MKITVLMENTTIDPSLHCEHGLSLYVETQKHKILFDMGQTAAFADNAQKLGIDLAAVDLAVLSHGHYDHGGGLARFLEIAPGVPVYMSCHAFEPYYNRVNKYIGLDKTLEESEQWILTTMDVGLDQGMELLMAEGREGSFPLDLAGLQRMEGDVLVPEDFRHEQYLMIRENGKRILFSGCSHRGILNIMEWFHPDILIGGFHFSKMDPEGDGRETLDQAARILSQYDCTYYTCHCTGLRQYDYLKEKMGDQLQYLSTGQQIVLHHKNSEKFKDL